MSTMLAFKEPTGKRASGKEEMFAYVASWSTLVLLTKHIKFNLLFHLKVSIKKSLGVSNIFCVLKLQELKFNKDLEIMVIPLRRMTPGYIRLLQV